MALEAAGQTKFDCSDIPDKRRREDELNLLKKCDPIRGGVFKKLQPKTAGVLD